MASPNPKDSEFNEYRSACWENALHTYATSYIFQQRARRLKTNLRRVNYVGVIVPVVIGLLVISFGSFGLLPVALGIAAAIGIGQAIVNVWSLVAVWIEEYAYATGSSSANDSLSERFNKLGERPPSTLKELAYSYDMLKVEDSARRDRDMEKSVTEEEKRMGMRAGLRKFKKECSACREVPTSMQPTTCGVCGNFKIREK